MSANQSDSGRLIVEVISRIVQQITGNSCVDGDIDDALGRKLKVKCSSLYRPNAVVFASRGCVHLMHW